MNYVLLKKRIENENKKTILYGLNENTEKIIKKKISKKIIGVSGNEKETGKLLGKKFFSIKKIIKKNILIVITAKKPTNIVIFNELRRLSNSSTVSICDIDGKNFDKKNELNFKSHYKSILDIKKKILSHDVISFDLFDFLVERKNKSTWGQIENIANELVKTNKLKKKFVKERLIAEKKISKKNNTFSLNEIYFSMRKKFKFNKKKENKIIKDEFSLDVKRMYLRQEIKEILLYTLRYSLF